MNKMTFFRGVGRLKLFYVSGIIPKVIHLITVLFTLTKESNHEKTRRFGSRSGSDFYVLL